jgi:enolase
VPTIADLHGREILDSRGRPTVKAYCRLASGAEASASVPSGASTGGAEAVELRDGDSARHRGLGCRNAAANVGGELKGGLVGRAFGADRAGQESLDRAMIALDGTPAKSRLGANALLAASLAFARAVARERGVALYRHFADLLGAPARRLPRLTINLFSGGKHAGGQVAIQDVLVAPHAPTIDAGLAQTSAVFHAAATMIQGRYHQRLLRADEGGLAPPSDGAEAMIAEAVEAIAAAGLAPGRDVSLAIDVASSHFYDAGRYRLDRETLGGDAMVARMAAWATRYPIVSIEDGCAEEDWAHWPKLRAAIAGRCAVLGDDFLCTNPGRIERAVSAKAADALLLKVNQIGTLSEAADACRLARSAGWKVTVSARSGETEDDWLADLAVGWSADWIKIGSITQSERLAKYNRLLEIEALEGWPLG